MNCRRRRRLSIGLRRQARNDTATGIDANCCGLDTYCTLSASLAYQPALETMQRSRPHSRFSNHSQPCLDSFVPTTPAVFLPLKPAVPEYVSPKNGTVLVAYPKLPQQSKATVYTDRTRNVRTVLGLCGTSVRASKNRSVVKKDRSTVLDRTRRQRWTQILVSPQLA